MKKIVILPTFAWAIFAGVVANAQLDNEHWFSAIYAGNKRSDQFLYLSTPESTPFPVSIRNGGGGIIATVTISNTAPQYYQLADNAYYSTMTIEPALLNTAIYNRGLHITAPKKFYADFRANMADHAGTMTAKGKYGLGKIFRVAHAITSDSGNGKSNFAGIIATEDNTRVVISDYNQGVYFLGWPGPPGDSIVVYLDKGESYVLALGNTSPANCNGLIGTLIRSDKDVSVNCGSWISSPAGANTNDICIDQVAPLGRVGTEYVLVKGLGPNLIETPIVVAHYDNTEIFINGNPNAMATINAGDYYVVSASNYNTQGALYLVTSKKSFVFQSLGAYTNGGDTGAQTGALSFIPPVSCRTSASFVDRIPSVDQIGSDNFNTGAVYVIALAGAQVNMWDSYGVVNLGPAINIPGNAQYVVYKTFSASGHVKVMSNASIWVSFLGRDGDAGFGGYYSGFEDLKEPKVAIAPNKPCPDTLFLDLESINGGVTWYKNGQAFSPINDSIVPIDQSGNYMVIGKYVTFCGDIFYDTTQYVAPSDYPDYQVQVSNPVCYGGNGQISIIPINSSVNYIYMWSSGQVGPVQSLPAGEYTITVISSGSLCERTTVVNLEQPGELQIPLPTSVLKCTGIATTVNAGGSFVSYQWSDNSQGAILTATIPGIYTVTATDSNGCSISKSVTVSDYPIPEVILLVDSTLCPNTTSTITALVSPTSAVDYDWTGASFSNDGGIVDAGTFSVTITDANGCTGSAGVSIEEVPLYSVSLTAPQFVCNGQPAEIELTVHPGNPSGIAWLSSESGLSAQVVLSQGGAKWLAYPPYTDIYKLDSLVISGYDCPFLGLPAIDSVEVDKIDVELQSKLLANNYPLLCPGDSNAEILAIVQSGLPPYIYTWSPVVSGEPVVQDLPAGIYSVTITGANGCTVEAQTTVAEPERLDVFAQIKAPGCYGDTGIIGFQKLSGQGQVYFEVNDGKPVAVPGEINGLEPGTYNIHVSDEFCYWDTTIMFPQLPHYVIEFQDTLVALELPGPYYFQTITNAPLTSIRYSPGWFMDDSTTLRPVAYPVQDAWVIVEAYTAEGCLLTDRIYLKVTNSRIVYVPNVFHPGSDGENATFYISAREGAVRKMSIQIFDRWGGKVFENADFLPNDPSVGWAGMNRGQYVNPGVFALYLRVEYVDGTIQCIKGDMTVVR